MPKSIDPFLTFYEEQYEKVHTHIFYSTGCNKDLADDLTAEVFMKMLEHLHQYREESSMKTWAYRIVRNHIIDHYRARRETLSLDEAQSVQAPNDFRDDIATKHDAEQVLAVLPQLPKRYREIIILTYIDQLTPAEVADIMKMPKKRVYIVLHRATKKLQSLMT